MEREAEIRATHLQAKERHRQPGNHGTWGEAWDSPPPQPQMEPTSSTPRIHFQPPEPELGDNPLSGWYLVGAVLANNMEASQREWGAEPLSAPGSCLGPHEMSGKWDLSTNWGQPSLGGPGLGSDS